MEEDGLRRTSSSLSDSYQLMSQIFSYVLEIRTYVSLVFFHSHRAVFFVVSTNLPTGKPHTYLFYPWETMHHRTSLCSTYMDNQDR